MPGMQCRCGAILRYGELPCPIEWRIISDVDFDAFSGMVDAEDVYRAARGALRCPECRRLWVFWNGWGEEPEELVPFRRPVDSP